MRGISLGEAIKRRRLELRLTQKQLCAGICEPIALSRLENGQQTPAYHRVNALLERLDMPTDQHYALLDKNELELDTLHRQVVAYNCRFEKATDEDKPQIRKQALPLHQELETIMERDDNLSRQILLRSRVLLGTENGAYDPNAKKKMLLDAIHLTTSDFDKNKVGCGLYTFNEIKIINQLALAHSNAREHMDAISLFDQLYQYIQAHFQNVPHTRTRCTIIFYNYARELCMIRQFQKAIDIATEAQQLCVDYENYHILPALLSTLADCYYFLEEEEISRTYYRQAYYLMKAIGEYANLQTMEHRAKRRLDLDFDD